jgi:hypothetical protein
MRRTRPDRALERHHLVGGGQPQRGRQRQPAQRRERHHRRRLGGRLLRRLRPHPRPPRDRLTKSSASLRRLPAAKGSGTVGSGPLRQWVNAHCSNLGCVRHRLGSRLDELQHLNWVGDHGHVECPRRRGWGRSPQAQRRIRPGPQRRLRPPSTWLAGHWMPGIEATGSPMASYRSRRAPRCGSTPAVARPGQAICTSGRAGRCGKRRRRRHLALLGRLRRP